MPGIRFTSVSRSFFFLGNRGNEEEERERERETSISGST